MIKIPLAPKARFIYALLSATISAMPRNEVQRLIRAFSACFWQNVPAALPQAQMSGDFGAKHIPQTFGCSNDHDESDF
jgi:hypothetical protein